jgi:hypothetical protein
MSSTPTPLSRAVARTLALTGGGEATLERALRVERRVAPNEAVYIHGVDRRKGSVSVHTTEGQIFTVTLDGELNYDYF